MCQAKRTILFRGDSIPANPKKSEKGCTFCEYYLGNGLLAKFADGGGSNILQGRDELDMVLAHIGYEKGTPDEKFSFHSPMLAFTSSEDVAVTFMDRTGKKHFEECGFENATHFIWKLEFDLPDTKTPGRYELYYEKSSENVMPFIIDKLRNGYTEEAATGNPNTLANALGELLAAANSPETQYRILIFDAGTFLKSQDTSRKDQASMERALVRSSRDKEWLIYPCTPMPDGTGVSSRFQMNKYLRPYKWYRVKRHTT